MDEVSGESHTETPSITASPARMLVDDIYTEVDHLLRAWMERSVARRVWPIPGCDVEWIVQESFVRLWRAVKRGAFEDVQIPPSDRQIRMIQSWLLNAADRILQECDRARRRKREQALGDMEPAETISCISELEPIEWEKIVVKFSEREQQVIPLSVKGMTTREIGRELCIDMATVRAHKRKIRLRMRHCLEDQRARRGSSP